MPVVGTLSPGSGAVVGMVETVGAVPGLDPGIEPFGAPAFQPVGGGGGP